jgi:menaquinone-dependent protoporphyrinogen oxidase
MGATKEIAEAIGARLTEHGLRATVADAGAVDRVDDYDAIVLGSAIYATRWRPEAVRFVRRHRAALTDRKTWLFESGWIGTRPATITAPALPSDARLPWAGTYALNPRRRGTTSGSVGPNVSRAIRPGRTRLECGKSDGKERCDDR